MSDMRERNGITEIRESRDIDLDGRRLDEIDAYLDEHAAGLVDVTLTVQTESGWYGDPDYTVQYVVGWRPATDAEIHQHATERSRSERQTRQWQERQFAQLKSTRPDLFE